MSPAARPFADRFWEKIDQSAGPDACWPWMGARGRKGYGTVQAAHGDSQLAHRVMYAEVVGQIPKGLLVCHRCDNPPCVNPAHLWLGTNDENMADMVRKGRFYRRLTADQVREIRLAALSGETHMSLALRFGVARATVSLAVERRTWAHVV